MRASQSGVRWAAAALSLASMAGCATLADTAFLVRKVDAPAKSRAVTDQGIALYELRVLGRQDYRALDEARRYFEVALRFDPDNTRARQYLDTVDRYRESQVRAKTAEAAELLNKPARSEQETYTLLLLVRQAAALSPADPQAVSLKADTEAVRTAVVKQLMDRAKASQDQVKAEDPPAQREPKLLDVKDQYDRIHAIHPEYVDLQLRRAALKVELDRIFSDRAAQIGRRIDAGQFPEARDDIDRLDALNRRLDNARDDDIRDLSYRLNYQWARSAFEQKQLSLAEVRVDAALRFRRTDEAQSLRASIASAQRPAPRPAAAPEAAPAATGARPAAAAPAAAAAAARETALREVQDLVRRGELAAANRRIAALLRSADDPQAAAALREQQAAIRSRLPDLYGRGVEAYRNEDFKRAIDFLSVVVEIDVGYEQASEYLDKARAKQKLLEGLQGGKG